MLTHRLQTVVVEFATDASAEDRFLLGNESGLSLNLYAEEQSANDNNQRSFVYNDIQVGELRGTEANEADDDLNIEARFDLKSLSGDLDLMNSTLTIGAIADMEFGIEAHFLELLGVSEEDARIDVHKTYDGEWTVEQLSENAQKMWERLKQIDRDAIAEQMEKVREWFARALEETEEAIEGLANSARDYFRQAVDQLDEAIEKFRENIRDGFDDKDADYLIRKTGEFLEGLPFSRFEMEEDNTLLIDVEIPLTSYTADEGALLSDYIPENLDGFVKVSTTGSGIAGVENASFQFTLAIDLQMQKDVDLDEMLVTDLRDLRSIPLIEFVDWSDVEDEDQAVFASTLSVRAQSEPVVSGVLGGTVSYDLTVNKGMGNEKSVTLELPQQNQWYIPMKMSSEDADWGKAFSMEFSVETGASEVDYKIDFSEGMSLPGNNTNQKEDILNQLRDGLREATNLETNETVNLLQELGISLEFDKTWLSAEWGILINSPVQLNNLQLLLADGTSWKNASESQSIFSADNKNLKALRSDLDALVDENEITGISVHQIGDTILFAGESDFSLNSASFGVSQSELHFPTDTAKMMVLANNSPRQAAKEDFTLVFTVDDPIDDDSNTLITVQVPKIEDHQNRPLDTPALVGRIREAITNRVTDLNDSGDSDKENQADILEKMTIGLTDGKIWISHEDNQRFDVWVLSGHVDLTEDPDEDDSRLVDGWLGFNSADWRSSKYAIQSSPLMPRGRLTEDLAFGLELVKDGETFDETISLNAIDTLNNRTLAGLADQIQEEINERFGDKNIGVEVRNNRIQFVANQELLDSLKVSGASALGFAGSVQAVGAEMMVEVFGVKDDGTEESHGKCFVNLEGSMFTSGNETKLQEFLTEIENQLNETFSGEFGPLSFAAEGDYLIIKGFNESHRNLMVRIEALNESRLAEVLGFGNHYYYIDTFDETAGYGLAGEEITGKSIAERTAIDNFHFNADAIYEIPRYEPNISETDIAEAEIEYPGLLVTRFHLDDVPEDIDVGSLVRIKNDENGMFDNWHVIQRKDPFINHEGVQAGYTLQFSVDPDEVMPPDGGDLFEKAGKLTLKSLELEFYTEEGSFTATDPYARGEKLIHLSLDDDTLSHQMTLPDNTDGVEENITEFFEGMLLTVKQKKYDNDGNFLNEYRHRHLRIEDVSSAGDKKVLTLRAEVPFKFQEEDEFFIDGMQHTAIVGFTGVHALARGSVGRHLDLGFDTEEGQERLNLQELIEELVTLKAPEQLEYSFDIAPIRDEDGSILHKRIEGDIWTDVLYNGDNNLGQYFAEMVYHPTSKPREEWSAETWRDGNQNPVDNPGDDSWKTSVYTEADNQGFKDLVDEGPEFTAAVLIEGVEALLNYIGEEFEGEGPWAKDVPGTGKTVGEIAKLLLRMKDAMDDIKSALDDIEDLTYLEKVIEDALGIEDENLELTLRRDEVSKKYYVDGTLFLPHSFESREKFSLDDGSFGISGDAELYVRGLLQAVMNFSIDTDGDLFINVGTSVFGSLSAGGEDLRFNLGLSGSEDTHGLIEIQSDEHNESYVDFTMSLQHARIEDSLVEDQGNGRPATVGQTEFDAEINGSLPVFILGQHQGNIDIGVWDHTSQKIDHEKSLSNPGTEGYTFGLNTPDSANQDDGAIVADLSDVWKSLQNLSKLELSLFEKLKLAADGLDIGLATLQQRLQQAFYEREEFKVPLLGNSLDRGADFIESLRQSIVSPFRTYIHQADELDALTVARYLNGKLGSLLKQSSLLPETAQDDEQASDSFSNSIWGVLEDQDGTELDFQDSVVDGDGVAYRSDDQTAAEWAFALGDTLELGTELAMDLGLPGLGLKTEGALTVEMDWELNLGFGISLNKGFYLLMPKGDELDLTITAKAEDGTIVGSLGILELRGELTNNDLLSTGFGVDLNHQEDADGKESDVAETFTLNQLGQISPDVQVDNVTSPNFLKDENGDYVLDKDGNQILIPELSIEMAATLGILNDAGQDAPSFPNISADFVFDWTWYKNTEILNAGFKNITFDAGAYISSVLGPVIEQIQDVTAPIQPLIDFVNTPLPILNEIGVSYTILDIAELAAKKNPKVKVDYRMIKDLADLVSLVNSINTKADSVELNFGNYMFVDENGDSFINIDGSLFLSGELDGTDDPEFNKSQFSSLSGTDLEELSDHAFASLNNVDPNLSAESSKWTFPIIENPAKELFGLFLGQDADLVKFDLAPLNLQFNWSQFYPVIGPIGARFTLDLGAKIDLAFGYDTRGMRDYVAGDFNNPLTLVNGFYVDDLVNDVDVPELVLHGGLSAAAELNAGIASGGVRGGLNIDVNFDLYDPDRDGKVRLWEMWEAMENEYEFGNKAKAPIAMFDVDGEIYATFQAYAKALFWEKSWNIVDPITIVDFEVDFTRPPKLATVQGNTVLLNTGRYSAGRLEGNTNDINESVEISIDGSEVTVASAAMGASDQTYSVSSSDGILKIYLGEGNDKVVIDGTSDLNIEIYGGHGNDEIDLSGLTSNGSLIQVFGQAGNDLIKGPANLGTNSHAVLHGGDGRIYRKENDLQVESYSTGTGNDGRDTIVGGAGSEVIIGGSGDDKLDGAAGDDVILGDEGDVLIASGGFDVTRTNLVLTGGNDLILGGTGADLIHGGAGADRIDAGAGDDQVFGHRGHDRILGGSGQDTIDAGEGIDIVLGDALTSDLDITDIFADTALFSSAGIELSLNTAEFDFTEALSESDTGDSGDDQIHGGVGSDILFGDSADLSSASGGNDTIHGDAENDLISGDGGDDSLFGQLGEDTILGGSGSDLLDGGVDNDILFGDSGFAGFAVGDSQPEQDAYIYGLNQARAWDFSKPVEGSAFGDDLLIDSKGSNWLDGQGGNDTYQISFSGGETQAENNVMDSGSNEDGSANDVLMVQGTLADDLILLRASTELDIYDGKSLGMIALVPEDDPHFTGNSEKGMLTNSKRERVNYLSGGVDSVDVDASTGDDYIAIDGTASNTTVRGGTGEDTFVVGQVFKSERNEDAGLRPHDLFDTTETSDGQFLSEGVAADNTLNVDGGYDDDDFQILANAGTLNVSGGAGNDNIVGQTFTDVDGEAVASGNRNVDGGSGEDSYLIAGSDGNDEFFITDKGISGGGSSGSVSGVESQAINAGAGDDLIHILSTEEGTEIDVKGGSGNDTVDVGGGFENITVESADYKGHNGLISHTIEGAEGTSYDNASVEDLVVNILDSQSDPEIIFIDESGQITHPELSMDEGGEGSYSLHLSQAPAAEEVVRVVVSVPAGTPDELQMGDRGIWIKNGTELLKTQEFLFTHDGRDVNGLTTRKWDENSTVHITAPDDVLQNDDVSTMVSHSIVSNSGTRNSRSVNLKVYDNTDSRESGLIVGTTVVKITQSMVGSKLNLQDILLEDGEMPQDAVVSMVHYSDSSLAMSTNVSEFTPSRIGDLQIHWSSNSLNLNGANSVSLGYLLNPEYLEVKINRNGTDYILSNFNDDLTDQELDSEVAFLVDGTKLLFISRSLGRVVGQEGTVTVSALSPDAYIPVQGIPRPGIADSNVVPKVQVVQTNDSTDVTESGINDSYKLVLSEPLTGDQEISIRVSPRETVYAIDADGNPLAHKQVTVSSEHGVMDGEDLVVTFSATVSEITINVEAIQDDVEESDSFALISASYRTIAPVKGNVTADGGGGNGNLSTPEALIMKYNGGKTLIEGKIAPMEDETNGFTDVKVPVSLDGRQMVITAADAAELTPESTITMIRGVSDDMIHRQILSVSEEDADGNVTLTLNARYTLDEEDSSLEYRITRMSPSLFVEESASVDRMIINNQDESATASTNLSRPGLRNDEIQFSQNQFDDDGNETSEINLLSRDFEFSEYNLGSGNDLVDIEAVSSRQDGFENLTIVNSGSETSGGDQINVKSYRNGDENILSIGQVVSQGESDLYDFPYFLTIDTELSAAIEDFDPQQLTVKVTLSDGQTQYRKIKDYTTTPDENLLFIDRLFTDNPADLSFDIIAPVQDSSSVIADGTLAINAQAGDDTIDAWGGGEYSIDKSLIMFGGLGDDTIEAGDSAFAFGDRGQVRYFDENTGDVITLLGSVNQEGDYDSNQTDASISNSDYTTSARVDTETTNGLDAEGKTPWQTDGVRREPSEFNTMTDERGGDDTIMLHGDNNIVFGGNGSDEVNIHGSNNIAFGDGGTLLFEQLRAGEELQWGDESKSRITEAKSKSDELGGDDSIQTGEGDNILFGGAANDSLSTKSGDDVISGDGGVLRFGDQERIQEVDTSGIQAGGDDIIDAGTGQNTVFGGTGSDTISTGKSADLPVDTDLRDVYSNEKDVVLGDTGSRTFLGTGDDDAIEFPLASVLSFNFQGSAPNGLNTDQEAGIQIDDKGQIVATGDKKSNWNNISGNLQQYGPSTIGNDPDEILYLDNGERITGVELSYGASEIHRVDPLDLQNYALENYNPANYGADGLLYHGGIRTSNPNDHLDNKLTVSMDGLSEHFEEYSVVVYFDAPANVSSLLANQGESIRKIYDHRGETYFYDDYADSNDTSVNKFNGEFIQATATSADAARGQYANYAVFTGYTDDSFLITLADGITNDAFNGRDIPAVSGIQIIGKRYPVDVIKSSTSENGGDDVISTGGGEDIVLGGSGSDTIATFGDVRDGYADSDLVFGDDGKVIEMYRGDGDISEREALPVYAQSLTDYSVPEIYGTLFNDVIFTGNGNDVVIGGEGQDRINTERHDNLDSFYLGGGSTAPAAMQNADLDALQNMEDDSVRVFSVNFSYSFRDSSQNDADLRINSEEYAGAVPSDNWNNIILRDESGEDLLPYADENNPFILDDGQSISGMTMEIRRDHNPETADDQNFGGVQVDRYYGHNEIDPDSANSRLFNSYYWADKQEEIEIDIRNIKASTGFETYDVYVYIDGDGQRTDDDNFLYELSGGDYANGLMETIYFNDWSGNTFNGEFREVRATDLSLINAGVVPAIDLVGNYAVFRNVNVEDFSIRLKNLHVGDQSPLNQPSIAGIQIVEHVGTQEQKDAFVETGGDLDKDVVIGDSGEVRFHQDKPFGLGEPHERQLNKAVEIESYTDMIPNYGGVAMQSDVIVTGANRDVVLGGNGSDSIDAGKGNDLIIGDNANVKMVDYAAIGERKPVNLDILDADEHDNNHYIGMPGFDQNQFHPESLPGIELIASDFGGDDLIDGGEDNDLIYGQEGNDAIITNEGKNDVVYDTQGTNTVVSSDQGYATLTDFENATSSLSSTLQGAALQNLQMFMDNDFSKTNSAGTVLEVEPADEVGNSGSDDGSSDSGSGDSGTGSDSGSENGSETTIPEMSLNPYQIYTLDMTAGEEIMLVVDQWPGMDNAYWNPNIVLELMANNEPLPAMEIMVVEPEESSIIYNGGDWYHKVDAIPDNGPYRILITAIEDGTFKVNLKDG